VAFREKNRWPLDGSILEKERPKTQANSQLYCYDNRHNLRLAAKPIDCSDWLLLQRPFQFLTHQPNSINKGNYMKKNDFLLDNRAGCYVIAEAGLNHNGSIEIAKQLIDLAALAGANAVKFQKRTVDKLAIGSTLDALDSRFPQFGKTYREIRQHLEFDLDQYRILKKYSEKNNLDFICTAFDIEAVDFLNELGIKIYKLASHSATNIRLIEYLAKSGKPTILSTGMTDLNEIHTAVNIYREANTPLLLLHCVSAYPTPLDECNLNMINVLKREFNLPVGYSGHESGYLPTLAAVSMGAEVVERHYTLDNNMVGFDHKMSLNSDEFVSMVKDIRSIEKIKGTGEKSVTEKEWVTRRKYHVSMASSEAIPAGCQLTSDMVSYRNPGTGIPAKDAYRIIGKKAIRNIPMDELLDFEMFE
jgi:sialic acid synthase SpsE